MVKRQVAAAAATTERKLRPTFVKDPIKSHPIADWIFIAANIVAVICGFHLARLMKAREIDREGGLANFTANHNMLARDSKCAKYELHLIPDQLLAMIPFFFILIAVERILLQAVGMNSEGSRFVGVDVWSCLASGLQQIIVGECFMRWIGSKEIFCSIYQSFGEVYLPQLPDHWLTYVFCFLYDDYFYYWFHRSAHGFGFLWPTHVFHHGSERYGLHTALRQGGLQSVADIFFRFCVIAPFFPPNVFFAATAYIPISQFWFHTNLIRKLPAWIEYIFNTPSNHRVHHSRRVHANHGGFLILWDRLHNTYRDEYHVLADENMERELAASKEEICYFGVHDPIDSWTDTATQIEEIKRLTTLRSLWYGPGYFYQGKKQPLHPAIFHDEPRIRQDDASRGWFVSLYLAAALLLCGVWPQVWLLLRAKHLTVNQFILGSVVGPWLSIYVQGLVCDRKYNVALAVEMVRAVFLCLAGGSAALFASAPYSAVSALCSALWITKLLDMHGGPVNEEKNKGKSL